MKIYIACGLTHVPRNEFREYSARIHALARHLGRECNVDVHYALRDTDPQLAEKPFDERARLCYRWDRELVESSDIVVAEASFPSTGLGIELQIAETKNIPIILMFEQAIEHRAPPAEYETPDGDRHFLQVGEGFVTLMALGLPSVFRVVPYRTETEACASIAEAIRVLMRRSSEEER